MDVFPAWFLVSFAVLLGTVLGSFLNVVVARYPEGEPCTGRSHCPKCGSPIRARHNIPVFGWVMLRGRCADCKDRISLRYPLVEVLTGVLFGAVVFTFGVELFTVVLLVFACMSVALALIDLDTMRLPNGIVLTVGPVVIAGSAVAGLLSSGWDGVIQVGVGAGATLAVYALLWLVTLGRGLGLGDVKLAPTLGAVLGYFGFTAVMIGLAASWILGAAVAVIGLIVGFVKPRQPFPFGPYLIAGTWVAVFAWQPISDWYLSLFGFGV